VEEVLTVVPDGNSSLDDAFNFLGQCVNEKRVLRFELGSIAMAEDSLTVFVTPENREYVVCGLKALKYNIVEG
jgi:hypothetical protein